MQGPNSSHVRDLKRLGRYLKGHRNLVTIFERQVMPRKVQAVVDTIMRDAF